jgi:hypothetical protein
VRLKKAADDSASEGHAAMRGCRVGHMWLVGGQCLGLGFYGGRGGGSGNGGAGDVRMMWIGD